MFRDAAGVRWRVWHVETSPARAHLMDASYRDGWLAFEKEDGTERRRLISRWEKEVNSLPR